MESWTASSPRSTLMGIGRWPHSPLPTPSRRPRRRELLTLPLRLQRLPAPSPFRLILRLPLSGGSDLPPPAMRHHRFCVRSLLAHSQRQLPLPLRCPCLGLCPGHCDLLMCLDACWRCGDFMPRRLLLVRAHPCPVSRLHLRLGTAPVRNPVQVVTRSTLNVIADSTVSDHQSGRDDAGDSAFDCFAELPSVVPGYPGLAWATRRCSLVQALPEARPGVVQDVGQVPTWARPWRAPPPRRSRRRRSISGPTDSPDLGERPSCSARSASRGAG